MEVICQQRERAASYAFSENLSDEEKNAHISLDFLPVDTQYYLASFLLSTNGQTEVKSIISGFKTRLMGISTSPFVDSIKAPEANERLGFYHEIDRLHSFLQLETGTPWIMKRIWYLNLHAQRKKFDLWMKTEFPKVLEKTSAGLEAAIRSKRS